MTEKDLLSEFFPGVDPEFSNDGDDDLDLMPPEQHICVFCNRNDYQVEGMVYSRIAGRAICIDCIDACKMVFHEDDEEAREAWYLQRFQTWEERSADEPDMKPPWPHRSRPTPLRR
jgi:hypothetical protein